MKFLEAVLILVGMIIGAGMFGIPFSFVQTGFWLGAGELILLAVLMAVLHILYGEIVLATQEYHRMPGYARVYLGRRGELVAWVSALFGTLGSLLAYIAIGSFFLFDLGQAVGFLISQEEWALVLTMAGAVITALPLLRMAFVNGVLTTALVGFLSFLIFALIPHVHTAFLGGIHWENLFVPYGILLFALSGSLVVPEVVSVLRRERSSVRAAIVAGTLVPAILYFFFALAVVGVAGEFAGQDAIRSLAPVVGGRIVVLGNIIGLLAVFTSFAALARNAQELLVLDFGMRRFIAWFLISFIPAVLFFAGIQNFARIIGVVGAIAVGIDSVLIIFAYQSMHRKHKRNILPVSSFALTILACAIVLGALYTLYQLTL